MDANQQQQDAATELEKQMRADAQTRTSSNDQKSTTSASSPQEAGTRTTNAPITSSGGSHNDNASSAAGSSNLQGNAATNTGAKGDQGGGRRGKHHRSRRLGKLGKTPVGIPPPQPVAVDDTVVVIEIDQSGRPLPYPSGIGRDYGGRERERA